MKLFYCPKSTLEGAPKKLHPQVSRYSISAIYVCFKATVNKGVKRSVLKDLDYKPQRETLCSEGR